MASLKKNASDIIHKLDDFDNDNEEIILIALKSNMPDYKMAYVLNRDLGLDFKKVIPEISLTENGTAFLRSFHFNDFKNHLSWRLFENKTNHSEDNAPNDFSLFNDADEAFLAINYLIPEWKTIDFFILIENVDDLFDIDVLLEKLQKIKNISTYFTIDMTSLSPKSQKNLIF